MGPIKLPDEFTFLKADQARCTRDNYVLIDKTLIIDKTVINKIAVIDTNMMTCAVKPTCDAFRNCYFYRTMKLWNKLPSEIRKSVKISSFKSKVTKFLWLADLH